MFATAPVVGAGGTSVKEALVGDVMVLADECLLIRPEDVCSFDDQATGRLRSRAVLVNTDGQWGQRWCLWRQTNRDAPWYSCCGNLTRRPGNDVLTFLVHHAEPVATADERLAALLDSYCERSGASW